MKVIETYLNSASDQESVNRIWSELQVGAITVHLPHEPGVFLQPVKITKQVFRANTKFQPFILVDNVCWIKIQRLFKNGIGIVDTTDIDAQYLEIQGGGPWGFGQIL